MRFMQVSEIQLGFNAESGKRWGRDRAVERTESLRRVVEKAAEASCELLVITGGLFSHQPVTSELEEVNRLFLSVPAIEIVWIAGESDCLRPNSPIKSFSFAPNVHFIESGAPVRLDLFRLNTAVYALSKTDERFAEEAGETESETEGEKEAEADSALQASPLERLLSFAAADSEAKESIRFLVCRGASLEETKHVLHKAASQFSYAAVGGGRSYQELVPDKAYDSGCVEPLGMHDAGMHGVCIGDISNATGRLIKLDFVPLAKASYLQLVFQVTEETTAKALLQLAEEELSARGKNNIYRLRLTGRRDPDETFDLSELEDRYRIEEIVDDTEPQYNFAALFAEHPQDMIGYYISTFRKQTDALSEIERQAMYYGIDALLKTADREKKQ